VVDVDDAHILISSLHFRWCSAYGTDRRSGTYGPRVDSRSENIDVIAKVVICGTNSITVLQTCTYYAGVWLSWIPVRLSHPCGSDFFFFAFYGIDDWSMLCKFSPRSSWINAGRFEILFPVCAVLFWLYNSLLLMIAFAGLFLYFWYNDQIALLSIDIFYLLIPTESYISVINFACL
jgi:hypothetical protein